MNSKFPDEEAAEFIPEEATLIMRIRVFVNMRWLAILGIIVATITASSLFHIGFPTLPVYIICAFVALYNLVFLYQTRSLSKGEPSLLVARARTYGYIHISLDLIALTVLLHFTGGIENPFIFLFILHIIAAGIVLPYRATYLVTTAAFLMVTALVLLEYAGIVPHVNLEGFVLPYRYQQTSRVAAILVALAVLLYSSTYLTTAISGELRKRQRQVLALREQLLKEKVEELDVSAKEIDKLEEEKKRFLRFLGMAAHDLKAPLAAIKGFLSLILGGYVGEISDKQRNMLDRSSRRIDELLELISDLLDIPRIEAGQLVREMKELSLAEIVKRCVDELGNVAQEKGLELRVELPDGMAKIYGSETRLRQVITNLLSNALNYTSEGSVTIRVTERDTEQQVEIIDTGIGIPPDDLPHIFDDFFRGSNVVVKGTGLGLPLAKRIIEAHGGKIWAESPYPETKRGSRFACTLPKSG
jgi:signal transduction histidine kinase